MRRMDHVELRFWLIAFVWINGIYLAHGEWDVQVVFWSVFYILIAAGVVYELRN